MKLRLTTVICVVLVNISLGQLAAQSPARSASPATSSPTPAASATPTTKALVDGMSTADLEQAIQFLKNNYLNPALLNETELNRATFEGLLIRLGRGVVLLPESNAEPNDSGAPFYGEILEGHIGYLRLGSLTKQNLEAMDTSLQAFVGKKVDALVLDLRASPATNDFATASEFAKRFSPKTKPLFTLRKIVARQERSFTSDRDPTYQGLIIVLADGDTTGAAEAIAGVVRLYNKALIIGQPTAGRAVEYSDLKLASGKLLRVAVGETVLPEDRPLFPGGLKPDVPVEMSAADKREVFQQSREKGMSSFIYENERPHVNEAALISGRNPEIDAMEAAQRRGRPPEKSNVRDPVLQRALDLVTSIAIYQHR